MCDYFSGDADAARWDAYEARMMEDERQIDELERTAKLLQMAAVELSEMGRTRRFTSLLLRSHNLTAWRFEGTDNADYL